MFHCRSEIEIKRQQLARLQRRRQDLHDERTVVEDLIGEWREASEATLGKAQRSAQDAATQMRALRHNRDDAAVALELIRTGGMGGKAGAGSAGGGGQASCSAWSRWRRRT